MNISQILMQPVIASVVYCVSSLVQIMCTRSLLQVKLKLVKNVILNLISLSSYLKAGLLISTVGMTKVTMKTEQVKIVHFWTCFCLKLTIL